MIKHIVMFKLKAFSDGRSSAENALSAKSLAEKLFPEIPPLKKFEAVINADGTSNTNCELALICEFDDIDGLDAYLLHPKHIEFGDFIKAVRESRACIDYEC